MECRQRIWESPIPGLTGKPKRDIWQKITNGQEISAFLTLCAPGTQKQQNQISLNVHSIWYLKFFIFLKISRKHMRRYQPFLRQEPCQCRSKQDITAMLTQLTAKQRGGWRMRQRTSNKRELSAGPGPRRFYHQPQDISSVVLSNLCYYMAMMTQLCMHWAFL